MDAHKESAMKELSKVSVPDTMSGLAICGSGPARLHYSVRVNSPLVPTCSTAEFVSSSYLPTAHTMVI